ncbi:MAG: hypothetical protein M5R41_18470 [Bacteroidia bacterium]|nr:hypothetical protein [Bacteroidia bacterium]
MLTHLMESIPALPMTVSLSDFVPFLLIPFIGWGVRHYLRRRNDWVPLKRWTFSIGISAYFLTETARSFYRPFIYANGINDFHIADTIGNSAGTVTAIFMIITLSNTGKVKPYQLMLMTFAGLIGYELLSASANHPVDVWDLLATALFSILSWVVYYGILEPSFAQGPTQGGREFNAKAPRRKDAEENFSV